MVLIPSALTTYKAIKEAEKRQQKKKQKLLWKAAFKRKQNPEKTKCVSNIGPLNTKNSTTKSGLQKNVKAVKKTPVQKKKVLTQEKLNTSKNNKKINEDPTVLCVNGVTGKKRATSANKNSSPSKKIKNTKLSLNGQQLNGAISIGPKDKSINSSLNDVSNNDNKIIPSQISLSKIKDQVSQSCQSENNSVKVSREKIKKKLVNSEAATIPKLKKAKLHKISGKKKSVKKVVHEVNKDTSSADDSEKLGMETFEWIISPLSIEDFFNDYWERNELLIKRNNRNKFEGILSVADIDNILRRNNVEFTKNLDVTSYKDGKRETLNPEGRAYASLVWDFYNSGCSVRMLNPQTFHRPVWKLLAILQEYFTSFCGANVYLTPPGTQGFAPHWDDIEAFILQLEGKKRWRVYKPRNLKETLPRESSGNFGPDDELGEPVLDCILEPGDLLYFPRGFIHQGEALSDIHSLHITISTYQKNSWVDLLEKLVPAALATAAEEDLEFRKGLPLEYLSHLGIANADKESYIRKEITKKVSDLVMKMMDYAPIDAAVDQMAKGFIHDSLPPVLTNDERRCSVFDGGERWSAKKNRVVNRVELTPESSIRLLRRHCARLVVEEQSVRLFYSVDNSREYHADEPKFLDIEESIAPAIEFLISSYPNYVPIENLPLDTLTEKMSLAIGLWENGIITTIDPLEDLDDGVYMTVTELKD